MNKFATHDSLTAYPVKAWLLKPFFWVCQCQNKTLEEQYAAGARSFDLRFAKWRGKWYGAHGAMLYDITLKESFCILKRIAKANGSIHFRVLCEDTFYRGSDFNELVELVLEELLAIDYERLPVTCLYIRSKRKWDEVLEFPVNESSADYNVCWDKPFTFKGMERAKPELLTLQTSDDKINFIGCYSSKFIPRVTAWILTKFAMKMTWKENDWPVIDFI
jgi:hypothetical protein